MHVSTTTPRRELLDRIKQMEFQGYELEAAEGTFELLVREALRPGLQLFEVLNYEVLTKGSGSTATVTLKAQDGVHTATAKRQRSCERAGSVLCASASPILYPAHCRGAADRLQGPRARFQEGYGRPRARADRVEPIIAEAGRRWAFQKT